MKKNKTFIKRLAALTTGVTMLALPLAPTLAATAPALGAVFSYSQFDVTTPNSQARADLQSAYNFINNQACDQDLTGQDLNRNLLPGVYCFTASASGVTEISGHLNLEGRNDSNSIFIFKILGPMRVANFTQIGLMDSARSENVFWQVSDTVEVGYGTLFKGTIMANSNITFANGASMNGRALSLNGRIIGSAGQYTVACSSCTLNGVGGSGQQVLPAVTGPTSCSPGTQTVTMGQAAMVTPAGGNGSYTWTTSGTAPTIAPTGNTNGSVSVTYANAGLHTVTVVSAGQLATCNIDVVGTSAPAPTPGLPNTGGGGEYLIYTMWATIFGLSVTHIVRLRRPMIVARNR